MYTPNDLGYYQPYIPQEGYEPRKDEYQFPYQPPPPPLSNSGVLRPQSGQQSYELQNIESSNSMKNIQKDSVKFVSNQKEVHDEYYTPTDMGDDQGEEAKHNSLYRDYRMNKDFQKESFFKQFSESQDKNLSKSYCVNIRSGVLKLEELEGIYIKQKFDVAESVTSCEQPNSYKVYPADCNGDKISNKYIFKCKEKSSYCSRNCLPGSKRPFNMIVKNRYGELTPNKDGAQDSNFLLLRRPFKCTCLCISRPELEVLITESGVNKILGKITQPFAFCGVGLEIKDLQDNIIYLIEGESCCMPAILCSHCPCRSCQNATFLIKNPKGETLSYITKRTTGCMKSCASDKSNFGVTFPPFANPEEKVLIMAATLFLDYSYFEESVADKHGETSHINFISDDQKISSNSISIPLNNIN